MTDRRRETNDGPTDGQGRPATTRGHIVVLNRDLFFGVRIGNGLRGLGYEVTFAPDAPAFATAVRAATPPAVLGIVDLSAGPDWAAIAALTADHAVVTPVLVFGAHKDVEGLRAAKSAGVTRVVSNGDFHRDTAGIVARYALAAPEPGA